jgi:acetylornithine deacetylase
MIESHLEINNKRVRQLLRKMVNIYSPSGKEADIVDFLHNYLKRHGLPVVRQSVDEGRDNLIVEPDDIEAEMVFLGHLDTVEAYDLQTYGYNEVDSEAFGLGTADMKGGCAAMVEAFLTLWENSYVNLPVALALVVGEEESGDGTQKLMREFDFSSAVVGEPTDLLPCLSHYSYLEIQVNTRGNRIHASLAPQSPNPVSSMLHLLLEFIHHFDNNLKDSIYNFRNLVSSQSGFAVPEYCEAWVDLHLPPLTNMGQLTLELEELHEGYLKKHPECNSSIQFNTIHAGYELPKRGYLVKQLRNVYKKHDLPFKPCSFPSHSDANILWASGVRPVIIGPGKLENAHAMNESIELSQVFKSAQIYLDIALESLEFRD